MFSASRTFPDYLSGQDTPTLITYPAVFDRRLDVDLVLQKQLASGLEAGIRWNFGTGLPYSRPLGNFVYLLLGIHPGVGLEWQDGLQPEGDDPDLKYGAVLGKRNGARYPARHRLDVTLRWVLRRSWGTVTPYLNVLNLYNRKNVLYYVFEYEKTPPVRTGISMFPILPTLGVEISF